MKKTYSSFLFVILLTIVSFFYSYQEILFKKPQSIHKWRQADCASLALNYYQNGMHFFQPETNNLTSDGGTSGKNCTSEVPILYYTVACFYKVFGHHDYIYRILNTLIFFTGLFFLFKLIRYVLKDVFWAILIALLFFTSPVLVFYGNNFLTNSSALAFSIIALYYFIKFYFEHKQKWFHISMGLFLIAAAFKITALFSLCAIIGIYMLEWLNFKKNGNKIKELFKNPFYFFTPILVIFIVIGLWTAYANYYNKLHNSSYFSTTIFPIWNLNKEDIITVISRIKDVWLYQYFHQSVLLFIIVSFLFITFFAKKSSMFLTYLIGFILVEATIYILLQFAILADHDYYTIEIYILPILIIICAFDVLKKHHLKIFNSVIFKTVFTFFLLFNVYYAKAKIDNRYNGWMNDYPQNKDLYFITPYLRQIGLIPNDTVISIPDGSHASLYLMNQKGWTEYVDAHLHKKTPTPYNHDSLGIQSSINKGAKYLIINGIEELNKKPYLQYFCKNLIGHFNSVLVFQLKTNIVNFNAQQNKVENKFTCNAELVTKDKQFFINETDSTVFEYGVTQNEEYAHSGKYSCKLDAAIQYGMTMKCKDLKYGENFSICVWRKINNNTKAGIIASAKDYYNNEYKIIETSSGWEKICKTVFISSELANKELTIYLYNPDGVPVYFDDFEIIRYKGFSM